MIHFFHMNSYQSPTSLKIIGYNPKECKIIHALYLDFELHYNYIRYLQITPGSDNDHVQHHHGIWTSHVMDGWNMDEMVCSDDFTWL